MVGGFVSPFGQTFGIPLAEASVTPQNQIQKNNAAQAQKISTPSSAPPEPITTNQNLTAIAGTALFKAPTVTGGTGRVIAQNVTPNEPQAVSLPAPSTVLPVTAPATTTSAATGPAFSAAAAQQAGFQVINNQNAVGGAVLVKNGLIYDVYGNPVAPTNASATISNPTGGYQSTVSTGSNYVAPNSALYQSLTRDYGGNGYSGNNINYQGFAQNLLNKANPSFQFNSPTAYSGSYVLNGQTINFTGDLGTQGSNLTDNQKNAQAIANAYSFINYTPFEAPPKGAVPIPIQVDLNARGGTAGLQPNLVTGGGGYNFLPGESTNRLGVTVQSVPLTLKPGGVNFVNYDVNGKPSTPRYSEPVIVYPNVVFSNSTGAPIGFQDPATGQTVEGVNINGYTVTLSDLAQLPTNTPSYIQNLENAIANSQNQGGYTLQAKPPALPRAQTPQDLISLLGSYFERPSSSAALSFQGSPQGSQGQLSPLNSAQATGYGVQGTGTQAGFPNPTAGTPQTAQLQQYLISLGLPSDLSLELANIYTSPFVQNIRQIYSQNPPNTVGLDLSTPQERYARLLSYTSPQIKGDLSSSPALAYLQNVQSNINNLGVSAGALGINQYNRLLNALSNPNYTASLSNPAYINNVLQGNAPALDQEIANALAGYSKASTGSRPTIPLDILNNLKVYQAAHPEAAKPINNLLSSITTNINEAPIGKIPIAGPLVTGAFSYPFALANQLGNPNVTNAQEAANVAQLVLLLASLGYGAGAEGGVASGISNLPTPGGTFAKNAALGLGLTNLASIGQGQGFATPTQDVESALILGGLGFADVAGPRIRYLPGQGIDVGALTLKTGPQTEFGLLNIVKTPDGYRIGTGTPSLAESMIKPQLNAQKEPISFFPATKGFKATETPKGESSDLLTTPFGRAILQKTVDNIKAASPIDAQYADSWLKVASSLSNAKYPAPAELNLQIKDLTPEQNTFVTDLIKKYSRDISELRGSISQRSQMGEAFSREPNDADPTFTSEEQAVNFVKEAMDGLNKLGAKTSIDPAKPTLLLKSEGGHLIDAKFKGESDAYSKASGSKTPLGLKQNQPIEVEGVKLQSVLQSLKDKIASALSIRLYTLDDLAKLKPESQGWKDFLRNQGIDTATLGQLNPLQERLAKLVTDEGGYVGGSSAVKLQLPAGAFRETGDVDMYTNDPAKVATITEKALAAAKEYYSSIGRNPEDLTISPTGNEEHTTIFDTNLLRPVADVIYRTTTSTNENFIPDEIVNVNGLRARAADQIIRDKSQAVRVSEKIAQLKTKASTESNIKPISEWTESEINEYGNKIARAIGIKDNVKFVLTRNEGEYAHGFYDENGNFIIELNPKEIVQTYPGQGKIFRSYNEPYSVPVRNEVELLNRLIIHELAHIETLPIGLANLTQENLLAELPLETTEIRTPDEKITEAIATSNYKNNMDKINAIAPPKISSLTENERLFLEKNAASISEAKIAKAIQDIELYQNAQTEIPNVRMTFAPNDWRIKDVIDPYAQTKFLNQYNYNPISRLQIERNLELAKEAAKVKFGLTDADFNVDAQVDLTPLIKGNAPAAGIANTDLLFRTAAPTNAQSTANVSPAPLNPAVRPETVSLPALMPPSPAPEPSGSTEISPPAVSTLPSTTLSEQPQPVSGSVSTQISTSESPFISPSLIQGPVSPSAITISSPSPSIVSPLGPSPSPTPISASSAAYPSVNPYPSPYPYPYPYPGYAEPIKKYPLTVPRTTKPLTPQELAFLNDFAGYQAIYSPSILPIIFPGSEKFAEQVYNPLTALSLPRPQRVPIGANPLLLQSPKDAGQTSISRVSVPGTQNNANSSPYSRIEGINVPAERQNTRLSLFGGTQASPGQRLLSAVGFEKLATALNQFDPERFSASNIQYGSRNQIFQRISELTPEEVLEVVSRLPPETRSLMVSKALNSAQNVPLQQNRRLVAV